jgi:hypothetical protein
MRRSTHPARSATERATVRRAAALAVALWSLLAAASVSAEAPTVGFSASFGQDARLGASTSLTLSLRLPDRLPPATEVRLLTPAGIDLNDSGLGLATCARPEAELRDVMHVVVHRPCPGNALMGTGTATAQLRFDPTEIYSATAQLDLYAGTSVAEKPGLLVVADAYRPVRTQLTYRGYLYVPPPGFGLGMALQVQPIPEPPFGAPVALSTFGLTVGGPGLRYVRTSRGARTVYRPRAIPLPRSCPRDGFRFRAIVRFVDGQRIVKDTHVACPAG